MLGTFFHEGDTYMLAPQWAPPGDPSAARLDPGSACRVMRARADLTAVTARLSAASIDESHGTPSVLDDIESGKLVLWRRRDSRGVEISHPRRRTAPAG